MRRRLVDRLAGLDHRRQRRGVGLSVEWQGDLGREKDAPKDHVSLQAARALCGSTAQIRRRIVAADERETRETGEWQRFVKWGGLLFGSVLAFGFLATLGGSMIWALGGAHGLDIDGVAEKSDRDVAALGAGWPHYGGGAGGMRYSNAAQITKDNVNALEIAWSYSTGDMQKRPAAMRRSASEGTPILVDGRLVFCTPFNEVIALNPATGNELWRYDPEIDLDQRPANQFVCRGLVAWRANANQSGVCSTRIFMGTNDSRVIALDAETGRLCEKFAGGEVAIDPGMKLQWPGEFQITSPPVVIGDTVIVGSSISDNARREAPVGAVRAFDVRTGEQKWTFDAIPRVEDAENADDWRSTETPVEGQANVWAPMSVDENRGLVFLPTSSPSPDFYGGLRPGDNRYANSIVALKGDTGEVVWSFQTVHHDVWDYDLPAQPGLYSVWKDGGAHDVVVQVTKTGMVFVLDRDTGRPFLPVEERPVPQDGVPGEALSPTQPFPVATPLLAPDRITPKDAFGITWFDKRACAKKIRNARAEGLYTPVTQHGTLLYPGNLGGANWGGSAFDPARNLLVVNTSNLIHHLQLIPSDQVEAVREVYHDTEISPQTGTPYGMKRELLVSPLGLPCNPPPWGTIAGVDLASGEIVWRSTLGTTEELGPGAIKLGTPTIGGPAVTAGGLVFIGAAMDNYLRAFDVETGDELWKGPLLASAQATPMSYEWEGRQYVVIYAGGHSRAGTTLGDELVAYALPDWPILEEQHKSAR